MKAAPTPEQIAEWAHRLRAGRTYRDIGQRELADRLEVDVKTINRYENAENIASYPNAGVRSAIAVALDLRPDWFDLPLGSTQLQDAPDADAHNVRDTKAGRDSLSSIEQVRSGSSESDQPGRAGQSGKSR